MDDPDKETTKVTETRSRGIAIVLALFLGDFGIHKFYLGQTKMGVLYLLFCWTIIPAVVGIIEGIGYIFTSDEEFQRKYTKVYRVEKD